jgi:hypothetical protein
MTRPRRRLYNWLALLSSLLWLVTLILWQQSWGSTDTVWLARGGSLYVVNLNHGMTEIARVSPWTRNLPLGIASVKEDESNPAVPSIALRSPMATSTWLCIQSQSGPGYVWLQHGASAALTIHILRLAISVFPPMLLIPPMLWMISFVHDRRLRRQRRHAGQCIECGYDLRATPDRCPECGTVPPSKNKITSA